VTRPPPPPPRPLVRPAEPGDLPAVRAILAAYGNLQDWPQRPDYLDHELTSGRLLVATDEGAGEGVAAFGGACERGGVTYLSDLFVRPGLTGRGLGRALLEAILPADGELVTFASSDPAAVALYCRFGMQPLAPLLYLRAEPAKPVAGRLAAKAAAQAQAGAEPEAAAEAPTAGEPAAAAPRAAGGVQVADAAGLRRVTAFDELISGRSRPQDHRFLASLGATALLVEGGYAWIRLTHQEGSAGPAAHLGPLGGSDEGALTRATLAAIQFAAESAASINLALFGPHPCLADLLEAGFRLTDQDTFMATRHDLIDTRRYAPSPDLG
jgi:GNAT superfamily N-acetyltransferase